jgi:hypothetical protein
MSRNWWKRFIAFASISTFDFRSFRRRVHANGRLPHEGFTKFEPLYRRFDPNVHLVGGILSPLAFNFPQQSVNRGLYSRAADVLHKDCCDGAELKGWRVATILVRDIPAQLVAGDKRLFTFSMRHTPKPCCFPHSEVWCNVAGSSGGSYQKPPRTVREEFRTRLAQCAHY